MTDDDKALVERLRDAMPPHYGKCQQAANRIEALSAEVKQLKRAIKLQASAVRTLQANEETEINILRKKRLEWHRAVTSLDSELEANAILTAENERLASIVRGWHWLAVGPDEMGDYLHQRELIKASEPYASPTLKVLATPAPEQPAAPHTS